MARIAVRVEKSGRILIPAAIRRKLGLVDGESQLLLDIDETPVQVTTRDQAIKRMQKTLAKYRKPGEVWSEELIQERRLEAKREMDGE
jgi:AbrB family looped-hinge helix DNA binding protein